MSKFESVSIILPLIDETSSFAQTVDTLLETCGEDIRQLIVVVCERTTPESLAVCRRYEEQLNGRLVIHRQSLPFLGGALREGFELAAGSHVVTMASDLETDPHDVMLFIELARKNPEAVITASRWRRGAGLTGYGPFRLAVNWIFQKFFAAVYGTALTDLTYGYRLFPVPLVRSIEWEDLGHSFMFETLLKPLTLGVPILEVPSRWAARKEGRSHNTFRNRLDYLRTGIRIAARGRAA